MHNYSKQNTAMYLVFNRQSTEEIRDTVVVSRHTADSLVTHSYMFNNKGVNYNYRYCNELIYPCACVCMHVHVRK